MMTGWTFFFILVGIVFVTSQLFRVIDAIERPARAELPPDPLITPWMFWTS